MADPIRVVLIDDHHIVRHGLTRYLESFADIMIVGEAATGEAALEQFDTWLPDVSIVDLLLPGGIDGIETTRRIRADFPRSQVVVLTAQTDDARVIAALRAGAIGYLRKDTQPETLLAAIRAVARGQSFLDAAAATAVSQELAHPVSGKSNLTAREIDVLRLLVGGNTNREIAEILVISEETVKSHVASILSKLQLAHRGQAILYAVKHGIVSLDDIEL
ncbi:MAG: response regulator transcription factor [Anaerolineae bacterium]|nr:response regulator transcription factor [Anaerolineae bacterium]